MEQLFYQRPREKLEAKGVAHLTTIELLQIVLGSGNAKVSGARLAKRVAATISSGNVTLADLMHIDGIGFAKACQALAAMELGARLNTHLAAPAVKTTTDSNFKHYLLKASKKKSQDVLFVRMHDGAGRHVLEKEYSIVRGQSIIREISEDALSTGARTLDVALAVDEVSIGTGVPHSLGVLKQLKTSLILLGIQLRNVYATSKQGVEKWKV